MLFLPKTDQPKLIIWGMGGFGLVQLIKINFVPNILHLIVGFHIIDISNLTESVVCQVTMNNKLVMFL